MAAPASIDEIEDFTPACLANVPVPPVFKLRPAGGREIRKYEFLLGAAGLRGYQPADFRDEIRRALPNLYDPEQAARSREKMEAYWALSDQTGGKVDPKEEADVNEFVRRAMSAWPPLARMAAEAKRYGDESARIAASMFIVGWTGLDLEYRREDAVVPLELIDEIEFKLNEIEQEAIRAKVKDVVLPGVAFSQLVVACVTRLFLTKAEEKNSSSPPSSTQSRPGSTKKPSKQTAGASSKASASSESTKA